MCDFPVLLGLCVYFLLTSAFPLGDHHHAPDESFLASNISNSRAVIVDTTANDYLTLLSAPFDVNNPNPVDKGYRYDASSGQYPRKQALRAVLSEMLRDHINWPIDLNTHC